MTTRAYVINWACKGCKQAVRTAVNEEEVKRMDHAQTIVTCDGCNEVNTVGVDEYGRTYTEVDKDFF